MSLQAFIDIRDRVNGRADYPKGVTIQEFNEYLDRITGCSVSGRGMKIEDACALWNAALDGNPGF